MKKLIAVITSVLIIISTTGCVDSASPKASDYDLVTLKTSRMSPSGKFEAVCYESVTDFYSIKIINSNNQEVYFLDMDCGKRYTNLIVWADDEDVLWAYNSDIGTYFWVFNGSEWEQYGYSHSSSEEPIKPVPKALRELRPGLFESQQ